MAMNISAASTSARVNPAWWRAELSVAVANFIVQAVRRLDQPESLAIPARQPQRGRTVFVHDSLGQKADRRKILTVDEHRRSVHGFHLHVISKAELLGLRIGILHVAVLIFSLFLQTVGAPRRIDPK